jgi:transcription elongation factor GreA
VVDDGTIDNGKVTVGCKVTVQEEDFPPETYFMVGSQEADPAENKISNISPIGKALIDKKVGDTVTISTPGGEYELMILEIE